MADTPESGAGFSDAELDELVQGASGEETASAAEVPEAPIATPDSDESDEVEDVGESASLGEGTEQDDATTPESKDAPAIPAATPPPAPAPVGKPFTFKASGGVHTLSGALEMPDGSMVVPKDAQAYLRATLASEMELKKNFKTFQRETTRKMEVLKSEQSDKQLEAESVIALFADIQKMTPDERYQYFDQFDREIPRLQLEVERKQLARDRAALAAERNPQVSAEERQEQRAEAVERELRVTYDRVIDLPEIKALDREDVAEVFRKYAKRPDRLIVAGEKDGEELFDDADVIEELQRLVRIQQKFATQLATAPKAAPVAPKAAVLNAARNADLNVIPPTVANRAAVPSPKGKDKGPTDLGTWKKKFLKGDLDDED